MGLDFSHGSVHFGYSGFMSFREKLCKLALGTELKEMDGFGGCRSWDDLDDPIVPLLNHSDCDWDLRDEARQRQGTKVLV
jgi:hypothetical protein